jgi:NAD-dependent dihydropyrimidine dehydrogenase PreA subunit
MKREIVKIDEKKCTGCGLCVPNCHEGALQIIDNKAVLISDLLCDGLGACVGHCPEDAITIEVREAEPYDEMKVMEDMVTKGKNVVTAHLKHLKDHNENGYLQLGLDFLNQNATKLSFNAEEVINSLQNKQNMKPIQSMHHHGGGCTGSQSHSFAPTSIAHESNVQVTSQLTHWPIQLHLINPGASHFQKSDLLVAADCSAFTFANFHGDFLKGKKLVIACPKLDSNKEIYVDKIVNLIDQSQVNTITVMIMEVPCCGGLLQIVKMAAQSAKRKVPVKAITIGIKGDVLSEDWV